MFLGILMIIILYYIIIMIIIKIIQAVKRNQTTNNTSDTQKSHNMTNKQSIIDSNTSNNISVLDYKTKTIFFNKIASKSIDFVLVDKKNCRIKLCIELDDNTHKKEKRIERDNFINKLFKDLEIDLLRYPLYNIYYKDTLKKRIQENIKDHYYTN